MKNLSKGSSLDRLPAIECKQWFAEMFQLFFVIDSQHLPEGERLKAWRFYLTMMFDIEEKIGKEGELC